MATITTKAGTNENSDSCDYEFEIRKGRVYTVLTKEARERRVNSLRPIELQGLMSHFAIKPWTDRYTRSYLEADVHAAKSSLRERLYAKKAA